MKKVILSEVYANKFDLLLGRSEVVSALEYHGQRVQLLGATVAALKIEALPSKGVIACTQNTKRG